MSYYNTNPVSLEELVEIVNEQNTAINELKTQITELSTSVNNSSSDLALSEMYSVSINSCSYSTTSRSGIKKIKLNLNQYVSPTSIVVDNTSISNVSSYWNTLSLNDNNYVIEINCKNSISITLYNHYGSSSSTYVAAVPIAVFK